MRDNGKGLQKDQLFKAYLPHATSKISKAEDLESIMTLGFRGEALASIGAVSHSSFTSKTAEQEMGAQITCDGGEIGEVTDIPFSVGSEVVCSELFYNVPARKKFLKSEKSEENEVVSLVTKMALSRSDISFRLICDEKTQIETYGGGLSECISCIYGSKTLDNCFEIENIKNGISVSGFVGKLSFTKPTRAYQTLIVNGRYVTDNTVSSAVANAYGAYLMKRQYPFYVLSLIIPPDAVDVNVHPRKAEVRFSNNQIIYGAVYSTVSKVLDGKADALEIIKPTEKSFETLDNGAIAGVNENKQVAFDLQPKQTFATEKPKYEGELPFAEVLQGSPKARANLEVKPNPFDFKQKPGNGYANSGIGRATFNDSGYLGEIIPKEDQGVDIFAENKKYIEKLERERAQKELEIKQQAFEIKPVMNYVGQAFLTYLIFERDDELYLIDQHAAHERLLYDKLCEMAKERTSESQVLLIPYVFTVSREDFDSIYKRFSYFRELGIEIDILRDDSFKVSSLPLSLIDMNLKQFFDDLIYDNEFKRETLPSALKEKLMQTACKHAIKGGDSLSKIEIELLKDKISENLSLRCPHGRPVAVKITKGEIEKWFKRIV